MTFAILRADFDDRVVEVETFFTMIAAVENDELAVCGGTAQPQVVPVGTLPAEWSAMLKGTAYLILYNLVEAFVRRGFQEVFDTISQEKLSGIDLSLKIRTQWIEQRNRTIKAFDGSPKVYMDIANKIVIDIVSKNPVTLRHNYLPFSGNLNAKKVRTVCQKHGVDHVTDPLAKGGAALDSVMVKRNSLAHGDESFVECGRTVSAADLDAAKNEIILFMRSIVTNLESFAKGKLYRRAAGEPVTQA